MTLSPNLLFRASLFALLLGICAVAHAGSLQDISRLMKQGQNAQALEQVDKYLAETPKDPQGRFLKGLILSGLNRDDEAIAVFRKLTEDYPALPEPYNNMAVIYAQQKQYDKAKQALESALRTDPAYATAHENLGDIYVHMASQAYDKALQMDSANAPTKLTMIRELTGTRPAQTLLASAEPQPAKTAQPETKAEQPVIATTTTATIEPATPAIPKATTAEPAGEKPAQTTGDTAAEATKMLHAWAAAWSRKDVKAYLAFYAKDFKTPSGQNRAQWEKERALRIDKPGSISVNITDLNIRQEGPERATAHFRQHYQSANLNTASNKVLTLAHHNGRWLIAQERAGK
jgi:tetratricopeptide (TPR) repeat protein